MSQYIIANFDRHEYIRPAVFGEYADLKSVLLSYQGALTALAVLLSDGNGRGGGDLHSEQNIVGSWAGGRIAILDEHVKSAHLAMPGLEDVPLQQQLLEHGKDVSKPIFESINEGEKDYWACGSLNPEHALPLPAQREVPLNGGTLLLSRNGVKQPLRGLDEFFAILGVSMGLTPRGMVRRLQEGLDKTAKLFGTQNPWEVVDVTSVMGKKMVKTNDYAREPSEIIGTVGLEFTLAEKGDGTSHRFRVTLGENGDSTEDVFERLFPEISLFKSTATQEQGA